GGRGQRDVRLRPGVPRPLARGVAQPRLGGPGGEAGAHGAAVLRGAALPGAAPAAQLDADGGAARRPPGQAADRRRRAADAAPGAREVRRAAAGRGRAVAADRRHRPDRAGADRPGAAVVLPLGAATAAEALIPSPDPLRFDPAPQLSLEPGGLFGIE